MKKIHFAVLSIALLASACTQKHEEKEVSTKETAPTTTIAAPTKVDFSTKLQGKWQSTEDSKSVILIKDGKMVSFYEDKVIVEEGFEFSEKCTTPCEAGAGNLGCILAKGEVETYCYTVLKLTDSELEYSMVGGRGNTLSFKKI